MENIFVSAIVFLVRHGYTVAAIVCQNPGLILQVHINCQCMNYSYRKPQSRLPGATFTVATVCLPINMKLLNNTAASPVQHLPQRRSSRNIELASCYLLVELRTDPSLPSTNARTSCTGPGSTPKAIV